MTKGSNQLGNSASVAAVLGTYASAKGIAKDLDVSVPTVWRMARQDGFPQPVKIGNRSTRFNVADVRAWISGRNVESKRTRLNGRLVKAEAK